ncbi:MAG: UDP-N-acetylglucosamine 1-carboxyvinyltransferase [Candidatus Margulisiibacteriota bacterium]
MKKLVIKGGRKLNGTVVISGSKNAALPILAASILLNGETTLTNVPNLLDVITMLRVLRTLGIRAEYYDGGKVKIWNQNSIKHVAPYELVTKMRASFFVIGPILARTGLAKIPLPGGCAIGSRPVNIHIKGLEQLGATVRMEHGFVIVSANKLQGKRVYLDFPSVGATETMLMAATLASGKTIIENVAREPEIVDLANFLNQAGAKISGAGSEVIEIEGVDALHAIEYEVIPDRVEAGTFMLAAAITGGDVEVNKVIPTHVEALIRKLQDAGLKMQIEENRIRISSSGRLTAVDVRTLPYPGFPTDLQPQMAALLAVSRNTSVITETIFENRFMHVPELNRMGADIKIEGSSLIINGVEKLSGAPVRVSDLRAGAALVLAALVAEGETLIEDQDHHLSRGYENLVEKIKALGGDVVVPNPISALFNKA